MSFIILFNSTVTLYEIPIPIRKVRVRQFKVFVKISTTIKCQNLNINLLFFASPSYQNICYCIGMIWYIKYTNYLSGMVCGMSVNIFIE